MARRGLLAGWLAVWVFGCGSVTVDGVDDGGSDSEPDSTSDVEAEGTDDAGDETDDVAVDVGSDGDADATDGEDSSTDVDEDEGHPEADVEDDDGHETEADGEADDGTSTPVCGNGIPEFGEECDDGNAVNSDACLNTCVVARCGDAIVHEGVEACDDGNTVPDDGCTNSCALPGCGDGITQPGEDCDDANSSNTDACLNSCRNASCGDGFIRAGMEECDDANATDGDGCDRDCGWSCHNDSECSDGVVCNGVETCNLVAHVCNPGTTAANGAACDADANPTTRDICRAGSCVASTCGDGFVDVGGGESCEDGGVLECDGCSAECTWEYSLVAGTGGYARVPDSASLGTLTGAQTMEAWVWSPLGLLPGGGLPLEVIAMPRSTVGFGFEIELHAGTGTNIVEAAFSDGTTHCAVYAPIGAGWHHVAAQITPPGTLQLFVDGRVPTGVLSAGSCSLAWVPRRQGVYIGNGGIGGGSFPEPIDEVRISTGARYTAPFTPTVEFTTDASTVLLLHFDEASGVAIDSSSHGNNATLVFPATRSTRVVNAMDYGIRFAAGGGAHAPASASFTAMTGATTMEGWIEVPTALLSDARGHMFMSLPRGVGFEGLALWGTAVAGQNALFAGLFQGTGCRCDCLISGYAVAAGWHHVAYVWSPGTLRMFVDGTQACSTACACATPPHPDGFYFGHGSTSGSPATYPGELDQIRVSNTARYTAAFVPPVSMVTDGNTVALYKFDDPPTSTATDSSSNGNGAVMTSATYVGHLGCW